MVVEGLIVLCHENFTVLLSFHYSYHTLHHNFTVLLSFHYSYHTLHHNFTVLLSFHYSYHTLHHNLYLDGTLSPFIILQSLRQIKIADNIVINL